jgi:hypothetical protein
MASANTLPYLTPAMYAGINEVAREQIGFIPAVARNSSVDTVAIGQTVNIPIVPQGTAVAITPGSYAPDTGGMTPTNVTMAITNQYAYPIMWTGEEQQTLEQTGIAGSVYAQQFAQAFRNISGLIEADLAALHLKASRAVGTYNVQPFATANDFTDMSLALKILEDNGAPTSDLHAVLSTSAIANIRGKQSVLFKVNEAGTSDMLRKGIIGDIMGVALHTSAAVKTAVTAGTNNGSATTTAAGFAAGVTNIPTAAAGTGTIIAGDIITFAGDTNQYVVVTGVANVASASTTLVIAAPGLRQAIPASATAITTVAATDRNMVFHRGAMMLATRAPYMPQGGDSASAVTYIQDPVSKLIFQVAEYDMYRQKKIEVACAWGVGMIRPEYAALTIG